MGHQCWDAGTGDASPIRRVYRALDRALGRLLDAVGPEIPVVVFSTLGMDANHTGEHLLDAILVQLEPRIAPRRTTLSRMIEALARRSTVFSDTRAIARSRRTAYQIEHNEISGAVRVNLVGREPCGRVRPGREFDSVCARLEAELRALVDSYDHRPIVDDLVRCDRMFAGEHRDLLPDMLVVWRRDAPIRGARLAGADPAVAKDPGFRSGNHREGGIVFVRGPGISTGEGAGAEIVDLAPTLATALGVHLEDVDGHAIEDIPLRV